MANFSENTDRPSFVDGDKLVGYNGGSDYSYPFQEVVDGVGTGLEANTAFTNHIKDTAGATASSANGLTLNYASGSLTPGLATGYELIQTFTKVVDQSQIIAGFSTPVEFGMSPIANRCIIPISVFAFFDNPAAAPFSNGDFKICDRTTNEEIFGMSSAFLNTTSSVYGYCVQASTEAKLTPNTDLRIAWKTSNPTGGGSGNRLVLHVKYMFSPDVTLI